MMVKEKIIFWPLLGLLTGVLAFGVFSRGDTKKATEELSREIDKAMEMNASESKRAKILWDVENLKDKDMTSNYKEITERGPFFRIVSEIKPVKKEAVPVKKVEKKPLFKYKGRVMMGEKVMVIIENQGTGKSSFVKEGDVIGDFLIMSITEQEVMLRKKGGEEIVLRAEKKKDKE